MNAIPFRALLPLMLAGPGLLADTVSLRPVADTALFETGPDNNLGGHTRLAAGTTAKGLKSRALLRFELTTLPAGSVVTSASLQFQVVREPSAPRESSFELRRVLVSWGEGTKRGDVGAAATAGEATWKARSFPDVLWSTPGGGTNDYAAAVSAVLAMQDPGPYTFASTPALVADVQSWLDHPSTNFGWVVMCQTEETSQTARRIASREDATRAPVLQIEYTASLPGPRMTGLTVNGTRGFLTWEGSASIYQPQMKESLGATAWTDLGPVLQTNSMEISVTSLQSFFRVMALPGSTNTPVANPAGRR